MAEDEGPETGASPKKKSKLPLILGLALFVLGGGGGFYAVRKGLILGAHAPAAADSAHQIIAPEPLPDIGFVALDPMVINVGGTGQHHLRFGAQLEVAGDQVDAVTLILPRILDVLNGYLRALDLSDIEDSAALVRIRSQMLRRVQLVSGAGRVRDLLITEFVLD